MFMVSHALTHTLSALFSALAKADDEYINVRIYLRKDSIPKQQSSKKKRRFRMQLHNTTGNKGQQQQEPISDTSTRSTASQRTTGSPSTTDEGLLVSDDDSNGDFGEDSFYKDKENLFPPDMKEWYSYKEFPGYECNVNKIHGKTIEAKLGWGLASGVRDLIFSSEEERESFEKLADKLKRLDEKRARRQLQLYRKLKVHQKNNEGQPPTAIDQPPGDDQEDETIRLLIEIVSATDLPGGHRMDPYVVVTMGDAEIHKTSVLIQTENPIWTIKTGSLCLFCASPEDVVVAGARSFKFALLDFNPLAHNKVIGAVYFTLKQILECKGERVGYDINLTDKSHPESHSGRLYLRIREATLDDVQVCKCYRTAEAMSAATPI
jgi:hypothetical protein